MQNARLEESQSGIKIARGNINSLRYADDTTLMTENEEFINIKPTPKEFKGYSPAEKARTRSTYGKRNTPL